MKILSTGALRTRSAAPPDTASDDEISVRADADAACTTCKGLGWYWGWELLAAPRRAFKPGARPDGVAVGRYGTGDPVRLRCPCVDLRRSAS